MCKAVIFGGTTEGRLLYTYCMEHGISASVYVATRYGGAVLDREGEGSARNTVDIHEGRLTMEEMTEAIGSEGASLVLDATHPYAEAATENIRTACMRLHVPYRRIARETGTAVSGTEAAAEAETEELFRGKIKVRPFDSIEVAVRFLKGTKGNIFVTTGSRELRKYTALPDYRNRLYVRVLPDVRALDTCMGLGITGRHLAAMQGPFSEEMNYAYLREFDISWMVTKQSGATGGFPEKCRAAERAGAGLLVIRRQKPDEGISLDKAIHILEEWL